MKYPFILLNEYNDTLNYDYYSIFNFDNKKNHLNLDDLKSKPNSIYNYDYNIDDSDNIILRNPKFIENINFFGMHKKELSSQMRFLKINTNFELSTDNSILVKYSEINDIQNYYNINYYYDADILFYKLIYFLNQFVLYKKKYPMYLLSSDNLKQDDDNHPCSVVNIDEYYQDIIDKFDYDCVYDYCFFHNCDSLNDLFIHKNEYESPNCYCLPLYCKDEKSQKNSKFEKTLINKLGIDNKEEFDYSFNSKYNYYMSEFEQQFSKIDNFFNRSNFDFKCEISFGKKNKEKNNTYMAYIFYRNYYGHNDFNTLIIFIYNIAKIRDIISQLHDYNLNYIEKTAYGYLAIFIALGILLLCYIYISCNKLINKMNKIKNIRKVIITNANNTNSKNTNSYDNNIKNKVKNNINDNNSMKDLLLKDKINEDNINEFNKENENDNLINVQENKNFEKEDKSNQKNEQKDELDELIQLINDNLSTFKIEFNLNEELNDNINNIKKQYNEIIQVNKFKNKLLLKEDKEEIIFDNPNDNSISSSNNSINVKKNDKVDDLSVNIFCELISLSNHKFDFSNVKTNFYYNEYNDNSLYNLNQFVTALNEANNCNENVEITNIDKLKNALEHYSNNIHSYWKNYYDIQKSRDEI